ncbi:MAG TPA: DUF4389 domain-containing protein [Baekduia sp.]|nr:DUF4389 domain-containing protein [Baekduia sp.]
MTDQPIFEAEYVEQRSRLTTFFRYLLAIPHFVVLMVWGILGFFALVAAWFALVITGRYPQGLYDFIGGLLRYGTAVGGYAGLLTDKYPPFGPDTDDYPVHLKLPGPLPEYNRLHAAFRLITAIPPYIIAYAMGIVWQLGAFLSWFAIVVLGKQPKGLQDMIVLGMSYQQRAYAYILLLTEKWPPFLDPAGGSIEGPSGGSGLPPAPATTAPPAAPEAPSTSRGITGGDPLNG